LLEDFHEPISFPVSRKQTPDAKSLEVLVDGQDVPEKTFFHLSEYFDDPGRRKVPLADKSSVRNRRVRLIQSEEKKSFNPWRRRRLSDLNRQ
jgi:hypothetical protein